MMLTRCLAAGLHVMGRHAKFKAQYQGVLMNRSCVCVAKYSSSVNDAAAWRSDTFGELDEQFTEKVSTKSLVTGEFSSRKVKKQRIKDGKRAASDRDRRNEQVGGDRSVASDPETLREGCDEQEVDGREPRISKVVINRADLSERGRRKHGTDGEEFGKIAEKYSPPKESGEYLPSATTGVVKLDKHDQMETYQSLKSQRLKPEEYVEMMLQLLKERKLKQALELFEVRMLKQDRVFPTKRILNILINGCGQVGYTTMAFKLYRQMTDRGMIPSDATFTGLFNACANSPFPEQSLKSAHGLRNRMKEKNHPFNLTHYHVMMKAFGRCGDIDTVFSLADELLAKRLKFTTGTLQFMLMACASNKDAGFRFAIETWRKFRLKRVELNIYAYNLLLRVIRDCGAGKQELQNQLLDPAPAYKSFPAPKPLFPGDAEKEQKALRAGSENASERWDSAEKFEVEFLTPEQSLEKRRRSIETDPSSIPDLLSPAVASQHVVDLQHLDTPHNRLDALGGAAGFITRMQNDRVSPNIKTFTQLLEILPPSFEAEKDLILMMDSLGVVGDVDFFNILIKKRNFRNDYESAKEVLQLIQERALKPDVVTFGVLALGCTNQKEAKELLQCMEDMKCRPNVEIMGALLKQGHYQKDWFYVLNMLKVMKEQQIKPNIMILKNIEFAIDKARKIELKVERGMEIHSRFKEDRYKDSFRKFMYFYKDWLKEMDLDYCDDPFIGYRPDSNDDGDEINESKP